MSQSFTNLLTPQRQQHQHVYPESNNDQQRQQPMSEVVVNMGCCTEGSVDGNVDHEVVSNTVSHQIQGEGMSFVSVDDSSTNVVARDHLEPIQLQPPLFPKNKSSRAPSPNCLPQVHQLTALNVMMSNSGTNDDDHHELDGTISYLGDNNNNNGTTRSAMFAYVDDDLSSSSLMSTTKTITDENATSQYEREDKEVSCMGGSSYTSNNNKQAQRRAKRERRQRAKDGDAQLAFAGGGDLSQSIAVDCSMREIVVQGGCGSSFHGGSGHEWTRNLLGTDGLRGIRPPHAQLFSVDDANANADGMLANLRNTNLMGVATTASTIHHHQSGVVLEAGSSSAGRASSKPIQTSSKRNDLRSGKRNLMSSWCNNVHTQQQENKISNWIDHVPTTTTDIDLVPLTTVPSTTTPSFLVTVLVNDEDVSSSTSSEGHDFHGDISITVSLDASTTTSAQGTTKPAIITSPRDSTLTANSNRSFVNGIRSIVESCRLAPAGTTHNHHPTTTTIFTIERDMEDSISTENSHGDDDAIQHTPTSHVLPLPVVPTVEEVGMNDNIIIDHRHTFYYPSTTYLLGNNSELTGTASYPEQKDDDGDEQNACVQYAAFTRGSEEVVGCEGGAGSSNGVSNNTNITPVPSSSSLSLGFISTQPIIRKPRKVNTESPTKRSAVAAVSLNDSVYNLHHWDENEYGWFVVPTDNVVMDVGGVSTSASPHEQRQPSSVSGGEVLRCSPDEVVPHRSPRLIVLPISDTVGDIHSIVAKFQGSHQNTKHATTTSTEKENFESCVTREDVESEEMATTTTTAAAIMSLFGITLPSVLSTDALAELDDALASVVIAAQPLLPAVDVVGRGVAVVGGGAGDDDGGATLRCNEVHFPPTSSPSSSATMSSSITAAIVRSGATLTTAAPTNHNNNTTTTNNSSSSMFSATDVLAAFFTPTLSPATGSSVSPLSGRGGMLSSLSAVAAGGPDRFGCMKPISARDSRFEGVNTNTDVHTPPLSPQMKLLGVGLGSSSSQLIRPNSANHYTNVTASNTSWQRQFRMSVSALQEQQLSSSGSCFNNNNKNSSSILLKSTRWGESGTVADGSITTDESIPSSPPRTVPSSTSMAWSVSFPTNNASPPNNNPNPPSPIPPSSPLRNRSHPMFSEIVSGYGVTVDTLTHGATNHTLQLAQPLTGDSARNYRRNEARMQPSPQHEQLSEQED